MTTFIYPPILPALIEDLVPFYLGSVVPNTVSPLHNAKIDTRQPIVANSADTVNSFVRIESGDQRQSSLCSWDLDFLFHCYDPDEAVASLLSAQCGAFVGRAAIGQKVLGWYVESVPTCLAGKRLSDPDIVLPRYRGAATWRVQGRQLVS